MLSNHREIDVRKELFHPFRLPYDTAEEIQLRLLNTIVQHESRPAYILSIDHDHNAGNFVLATRFSEKGEWVSIPSDDPKWDFRPIPSGYITLKGDVVWMERLPTRIFQQGITPRNTYLRRVGDNRAVGYGSATNLLKPLSERFILTWNDTWEGLLRREALRAIRLSNEIAVGCHEDHIQVYYRQRLLGGVREDNVELDELDLECPWIKADLSKVGMKGIST